MYKFCLYIFLGLPFVSPAQVKFVIETGVAHSVFATTQGKTNMERTETEPVWTMGIRASIEKPVSRSISLLAGIAYDTKASRLITTQYGWYRSERNIFIRYLAVPVGISGKFPVGKQYLSLGLNAYLSFPLSGYEEGIAETYTLAGAYNYSAIFSRITIGSANSHPNQHFPTVVSDVDYGAEASAQVHINRFRLGIRYSRGLKSVAANPDQFDKVYHNSSTGLTIGYRL